MEQQVADDTPVGKQRDEDDAPSAVVATTKRKRKGQSSIQTRQKNHTLTAIVLHPEDQTTARRNWGSKGNKNDNKKKTKALSKKGRRK